MKVRYEQPVLKCSGFWLAWETDGRWSDYPCHSCGNTGDEFDHGTDDWVTPMRDCPCCNGAGAH